MTPSSKPAVVADDLVVSLDYTLTVGGEIVDTSEGDEPIEFIQGHQNIIPGLEAALYGMAPGESKEVSLQPDEGYGEYDPDQLVVLDQEEIPGDVELEIGATLHLEDDEGEVHEARVTSVDSGRITLDLNHPLAGKVLFFSIQVVSLRSATPEELAHGHVHGDGHSH
ncbi:MAG TPA: peptidylprolyl isomerase [Anaerolineales bacterium]|nr:peptidylprolyl isomerase [Anaerolineales bacterium]